MKRIVTIGGGTGSYTVLRGLKELPFDLTAVVSMFDNGGSSGVLRDEFGVLPPGDVRRCLVALCDDERAGILRDLFNYRFNGGTGLSGHSFGNLFLVALASIYGSDIAAIEKASELLELKGRVLPVSLDKANLHAVLEDGTEIVGETNIDIPKHNGDLRIERVFLEPRATLYAETASAIREADMIVIGPGDVYSSIAPNLLVEGMADALRASGAKKVFVCNLMTEWGETNGFKASDIAKEVLGYSGLDAFDAILCNTARPEEELLEAYAKQKQFPVECDEAISEYAPHIVKGDFFSDGDLARHDSEKTARSLAELA